MFREHWIHIKNYYNNELKENNGSRIEQKWSRINTVVQDTNIPFHMVIINQSLINNYTVID